MSDKMKDRINGFSQDEIDMLLHIRNGGRIKKDGVIFDNISLHIYEGDEPDNIYLSELNKYEIYKSPEETIIETLQNQIREYKTKYLAERKKNIIFTREHHEKVDSEKRMLESRKAQYKHLKKDEVHEIEQLLLQGIAFDSIVSTYGASVAVLYKIRKGTHTKSSPGFDVDTRMIDD